MVVLSANCAARIKRWRRLRRWQHHCAQVGVRRFSSLRLLKARNSKICRSSKASSACHAPWWQPSPIKSTAGSALIYPPPCAACISTPTFSCTSLARHLGKCSQNAQFFTVGRHFQGFAAFHEVAEFSSFQARSVCGGHDLCDFFLITFARLLA